MSLTNEEKLELAKKCGAAYGPTTDNICFLNREQLGKYTDAYTSAIEERYQEENARLQQQVSDSATMWTEQCAENKKYQAQIAMLQNSVKRVLISFGSENDCPAIGYIEPMALDFVGTGSVSAGERAEKDFYRTVIQPCEHALSATQATADAFIAEVKAGAESAAVKDAMELLLKHGEDHDWRIMAKNMGNSWAELRNQQEGKDGK